MPGDRAQLKGTLAEILAEPGVKGVVLVRRDGIHVLDAFKKVTDPETFSAMTATLAGAADVALAEVGGGAPSWSLVNAPGARLALAAVDRNLLLALVCDPETPPERSIALLEAGVKQVTAAVEE